MKKLEEYVRSIPDFPEPGIIFRDVTSILQDADGLQLALQVLSREVLFSVCRWHIIYISRLYPYGKKENCRVRRFPRIMILSMEVQRSRCIKIL